MQIEINNKVYLSARIRAEKVNLTVIEYLEKLIKNDLASNDDNSGLILSDEVMPEPNSAQRSGHPCRQYFEF